MPSRFTNLVTSCLGSVQRITDVGDHEDSLLSYEDIGHHAYGKFSMAVVQANQLLEDQGQVESGPFGTFIGIYDGHNGPDVSKYISRNLFPHISRFASEKGGMSVEVLQMAFSATEEGFESLVVEAWPTAPQIATVGSCCLVGVINDGTLYIANAGDSRAVLGSIFRATGAITPVQLTTEHNAGIEAVRQELRALHPDDSRIVMQKRGVWRVKGVIQVSRAIGDVYLKKQEFNREPICAQFRLSEPLLRPVLTAEPDICVHKLQPQDRFLIFASDGLWEHISNEEAVELVNKHPQRRFRWLLFVSKDWCDIYVWEQEALASHYCLLSSWSGKAASPSAYPWSILICLQVCAPCLVSISLPTLFVPFNNPYLAWSPVVLSAW